MNRRVLIKLICAVALLPAELADSKELAVVRGRFLIIRGLMARGTAKKSAPTLVMLSRAVGTSPLLEFRLNTFGGFVNWWARPGDDPVFINGDTPILSVGPQTVAGCWGRWDDGSVYIQEIGWQDEPSPDPLLLP